jgi:hypothetical protein
LLAEVVDYRVSFDLVGLMSRDTTRQRPVPPVMAKTLLGWSRAALGRSARRHDADDGLALEGGRGVLDADDGAHPGGEADPAAD